MRPLRRSFGRAALVLAIAAAIDWPRTAEAEPGADAGAGAAAPAPPIEPAEYTGPRGGGAPPPARRTRRRPRRRSGASSRTSQPAGGTDYVVLPEGGAYAGRRNGQSFLIKCGDVGAEAEAQALRNAGLSRAEAVYPLTIPEGQDLREWTRPSGVHVCCFPRTAEPRDLRCPYEGRRPAPPTPELRPRDPGYAREPDVGGQLRCESRPITVAAYRVPGPEGLPSQWCIRHDPDGLSRGQCDLYLGESTKDARDRRRVVDLNRALELQPSEARRVGSRWCMSAYALDRLAGECVRFEGESPQDARDRLRASNQAAPNRAVPEQEQRVIEGVRRCVQVRTDGQTPATLYVKAGMGDPAASFGTQRVRDADADDAQSRSYGTGQWGGSSQ